MWDFLFASHVSLCFCALACDIISKGTGFINSSCAANFCSTSTQRELWESTFWMLATCYDIYAHLLASLFNSSIFESTNYYICRSHEEADLLMVTKTTSPHKVGLLQKHLMEHFHSQSSPLCTSNSGPSSSVCPHPLHNFDPTTLTPRCL